MKWLRSWLLRGQRIKELEREIAERDSCIRDLKFQIANPKDPGPSEAFLESLHRINGALERGNDELRQQNKHLCIEVQEWKDRAALYFSSWYAGLKTEGEQE
jgi:hypothetical protein